MEGKSRDQRLHELLESKDGSSVPYIYNSICSHGRRSSICLAYIYICVFTMLALDCGMVSEGAHSALSMVEAQRL